MLFLRYQLVIAKRFSSFTMPYILDTPPWFMVRGRLISGINTIATARIMRWRQKTHSNPKPPDACWLKDTSRVYEYNCFMQKGTQPNQICSEGNTFSVAICHGGVYLTRLDSTRLDSTRLD